MPVIFILAILAVLFKVNQWKLGWINGHLRKHIDDHERPKNASSCNTFKIGIPEEVQLSLVTQLTIGA